MPFLATLGALAVAGVSLIVVGLVKLNQAAGDFLAGVNDSDYKE